MAGKHVETKKKTGGGSRRPAESENPRFVYEEPKRTARSGFYYDDDYEQPEDDWDPERASRRRPGWIIPVVIVLAAALVLIGATIFSAMRVASLDTIYPNVSVNGVDVGGLTVEKAAARLSEQTVAYAGKSVRVLMPQDKTLTVTAEDVGLGGGDAHAGAELAFAYGRSGRLLQDMAAYRACKKTPVNLSWDAAAQIDDEALRSRVAAAAAQVNASLSGAAEADIGEDGITIVKGRAGAAVDVDGLCDLVRTAFENEDYRDIQCVFVEGEGELDPTVMLQTLYDEIFAEPKNAEYDKETGEITEGEKGVSFDMEEALRLWNAASDGDEVFIPFIFTEPEVAAEDLTDSLFADLLVEKRTSLSGSSSNRINNVTLAAAALNGTVVNPGEQFDYNSTLGERTTARGYLEAGAYSAGRHTTEVGGGICQPSSTLYWCAMLANLEITTRANHMFLVGYVPRGFDATVSWGGPDFRFVNSRNYPIRIDSWVENGELVVRLWGTDEDGSYVEITSETWEDSTYYYAQTYRSVYAADGTLISRTKEAYSSYNKYETAEATPTPSATAAPTPTPAPTETPEPTEAPAPTEDPIQTETPIQTEAPEPSEQPIQTEAPIPTEAPAPTEQPTPVQTETPSGGETGGGETTGGETGGGEETGG